MNPNMPYVSLPDQSARIMQHSLKASLDLDWDKFCRHFSLRAIRLNDGMSDLHAADEFMLQEGFASATAQRPDLWFEVGLRYRSMKFGAMGAAMMTAQTLGEALEVACQYQALTYSLIAYRYVSQPNGACALIADDSGLPRHLRNFTQHRDLGTVRTLIADLMANEPVLERVTVAGPPPANWIAHAKDFPCPVQFHAEQTQWHFVPGSVTRPLPLSDGELAMLYRAQCDDLLGKAQTSAPISRRLAVLLDSGEDLVLRASGAARQLAMSQRTLHRRLAEEGTQFSVILDEARYRRARSLLSEPRMTVEMIAEAVGFAETSSFSRAFKRWSGIGPLEFRRKKR